jgi:hypothetical protein
LQFSVAAMGNSCSTTKKGKSREMESLINAPNLAKNVGGESQTSIQSEPKETEEEDEYEV